MFKLLAIAAGSLLALAPQAQNPDLHYDKESGFSIMKPPKSEEWAFKDKVRFTNSKKAVVHVVDDLSIEIFLASAATGFSSYDLKGSAENRWKDISTNEYFKEPKRNALKRSKLPGGGAGNVAAYHLDVSYKGQDGADYEFRNWMFISKRNRQFYEIMLINKKGVYAKYKKYVDWILSTFKTYKLPK